MYRQILVLWFCFVNLQGWALEVIPGFIPQFYAITAASDLPISMEQAHQAAIENTMDISLLDPDNTTNIWNKNYHQIKTHNLIKNGEAVQFTGDLPSRIGYKYFNVVNSEGLPLKILISTKTHNYLLRKNILEKIGYVLPKMQWQATLTIRFNSTIEKDLFLQSLKEKLVEDRKRWIKSEEELSIELQDVLAITTETDVYNLAAGIMNNDTHLGRRLLRAPYVAVSLVDTPESVNLFSWQAGRVVLNQVKLYHTSSINPSYQTSYEDARWIGRRILNLNRSDYEEIVKKAYLPEAVTKLLIEKIISRRNDLIKLFKLNSEFKTMEFDQSPDWGTDLKEGELVREFFDGYANRFSFGDPESPFSSSELSYYVLARGQSEIILNAISKLNQFMRTDNESTYKDALTKLIAKKGMTLPTSAVVIPSVSGNLILDRNIVTGPYMGTNHQVQLMDTMGFSMDLGLIGGIEGLPIPLELNLGSGVSFQRTFAHLRPVESLKKALKEPYKNLFVPLMLKKIANQIDDLNDSLLEDEKNVLIQNILGDLKEAIAIGESFIVTDALTPYFGMNGSISLSGLTSLDSNLLKVYAGMQAQSVQMARFHLYRADAETFQIYQDYGKNLRLSATLKLKSYIPILSFNGRWNKMQMETFYYPVSLSANDVTIQSLKALKKALLSLNHKALKDEFNPYKIEHKMSQSAQTIQFFFYKRNKIKSNHDIVAHHAEGGDAKEIIRRYDALTSGVDYENYIIEVINDMVELLMESDEALSYNSSVNPGYTVMGRAKNRVFVSEYENKKVYINYKRVINAWKLKDNKLKKYVAKLNKEVGEDLFNVLSYKNTDSILLAKLGINLVISPLGTQAFLKLSSEKLKEIVTVNFINRDAVNPDWKPWFGWKKSINQISLLLENDPSQALAQYHKLLNDILSKVTIKGFEQMVGTENVVYQGTIEGFRKGDESGDEPIFSDVYGNLPLPLHAFPTEKIIHNWKILRGEFLADWMMERAI